jgi:hypothetical protein
METTYLACALVGGTLIICQFLLTLLGLGGHHGAGGGHDLAGHDVSGHDLAGHGAAPHDSGTHDTADHDHHGASSAATWFLAYLTFRTVTAAVAFFGLAGLILTEAEAEPWVALAGATAAGVAAMALVHWLVQSLTRFNIDGTLHVRQAVGAPGTVYLSIPGHKAGPGKVHITVGSRLVEYNAVTPDGELATGAKVVVVAVVNPDTVEVAAVPSPEKVSHE